MMAGVHAAIGKVEVISTAIASAVKEQSTATREMSGNAAQAATGTDEVGRNAEGVRSAVGDAGNAASQVLTASAELARQAEALRKEVDSFIARVRVGLGNWSASSHAGTLSRASTLRTNAAHR